MKRLLLLTALLPAAMAHRENDLAVIEAYGWDKDISDDEIVEKLFELYQQLITK